MLLSPSDIELGLALLKDWYYKPYVSTEMQPLERSEIWALVHSIHKTVRGMAVQYNTPEDRAIFKDHLIAILLFKDWLYEVDEIFETVKDIND
jgi:hypothetical protein